MFPKVLTLCVAALIFQGIFCITRTEIRQQFQPTLLRLRDLASVKYQEASRQYTALNNQLSKNQERGKNSTQTQINKIKQIISTAKGTANITSTALACVKIQETAANRLSTASLNNCYSNSNNSALINKKSSFSTLSNVASYTVSWCSSLNPLGTQDESFGRCLAEKVPDLNRQINIVQIDYDALSNDTLHYNIKCLTDKAGVILGQISVISYEINVCFFTPL